MPDQPNPRRPKRGTYSPGPETLELLRLSDIANPCPGPSASALVLIPPAIAAGLGELGKHGSLISPKFGSGVRLAGVTTNMPMVSTGPSRFGADDFGSNCQVCTRACPPAAISEAKQMVRGVERWYVDFDKCIPHFAVPLNMP